jgi:hypothetical protein
LVKNKLFSHWTHAVRCDFLVYAVVTLTFEPLPHTPFFGEPPVFSIKFKSATWAGAIIAPVLMISLALAEPEVGDRDPRGGLFLFHEEVEQFWNTWRGVRVNNDPRELELYIHGEGKTVSFDGVVFFECDTDLDPIWKTASVWDGQPADLVMIADTVPQDVMDNARTVFCPR